MNWTLRRTRSLSAVSIGLVFVVVAMIAAIGLFQKARIATMVTPGETLSLEFSQGYGLREYISSVKVSGVEVGVVESVRPTDEGTALVKVKVDEDAVDTFGTAPSARIRPTTMLGGNYYIDIVPGGRRGPFGGQIPLERTALPVELDAVVAALPADARQGIRSSISDLNATLDAEGSEALRDLAQHAPAALEPTGDVLRSLRGTEPKDDLQNLVQGLESTSRVLSDHEDQLGEIVSDLARTSAILANRRGDLGAATATMPETLRSADALLTELDGTLTKLEDTAGPAQPAVEELSELLEHLDPVVKEAVPVVHKLRVVAKDARPLVEDLVPTSKNLTGSFNDLQGPVLDRVNGPILERVMSPWHGSGEYAGGGADRPLFKEVGYMFTNLARGNMVDANGSMISFHPGIGPGSIAGLPISLEQLFRGLAGFVEEPK